MAYTIKVPDIGEGIAEVELVAWHVQPGDWVKEDQPLADVMTDKAAVEIPSPVAGRVAALGGEVGQVLAVGSELVRIDVAGEDGASRAAGAAAAPLPAIAEGEAAPPSAGRSAPVAETEAAPPVVTSAAMAATVHTPAPASAERPIASPAVRRRAWELGIDLSEVPATGTGGRIMQADLDAFLATLPATGTIGLTPLAPPLQPGPAAPGAANKAVQSSPEQGQEIIPVIGLRRRIAQRMQEAKRHIPHFTYVEEVDVTDLEALRARLNGQPETAADGDGRNAATGEHLTLLPFIARAIALTLPDHPGLNAHFDDEAGHVIRYAAVHLGIATQTPSGLMVPVLRHAGTLDIRATAREISRLAEAARNGRITHAELSGSTITLTSLGALGGIVSTPIVNLPEVAIVGVNRIVERPVVRGGAVIARKLMNLSSSFDHRVIDGQDAARFIQDLRRRLEAPAPWASGN